MCSCVCVGESPRENEVKGVYVRKCVLCVCMCVCAHACVCVLLWGKRFPRSTYILPSLSEIGKKRTAENVTAYA